MHPKNGRLNMHLDYEKHPITSKQRRLNVIFYLNNEWCEEWNGDLQLWDKEMENCVVKCYPGRNKAVIFETTEDSWHGVPEKLACPEHIYRRSLAYYYVSPLENNRDSGKLGTGEDGFRTKAVFGRQTSGRTRCKIGQAIQDKTSPKNYERGYERDMAWLERRRLLVFLRTRRRVIMSSLLLLWLTCLRCWKFPFRGFFGKGLGARKASTPLRRGRQC